MPRPPSCVTVRLGSIKSIGMNSGYLPFILQPYNQVKTSFNCKIKTMQEGLLALYCTVYNLQSLPVTVEQ